MSTLGKARAVCILIMLIGLVWLTIDVFGAFEPDSVKAAALITWAGLLGNAVCVLLRLRNKKK